MTKRRASTGVGKSASLRGPTHGEFINDFCRQSPYLCGPQRASSRAFVGPSTGAGIRSTNLGSILRHGLPPAAPGPLVRRMEVVDERRRPRGCAVAPAPGTTPRLRDTTWKRLNPLAGPASRRGYRDLRRMPGVPLAATGVPARRATCSRGTGRPTRGLRRAPLRRRAMTVDDWAEHHRAEGHHPRPARPRRYHLSLDQRNALRARTHR